MSSVSTDQKSDIQIIDGVECTLHPATCKLCGVGMEIGISIDYDFVSDPQKILPLATCNRCADLRERRRKITEAIDRCMTRLVAMSPKELNEQKEDYRRTLIVLVKSLCRVAADFNELDEESFDPEIVEQLLVVRQVRPDGKKVTGSEAMQIAASIIRQCWRLNKRPF